jgi:hypothetical protein
MNSRNSSFFSGVLRKMAHYGLGWSRERKIVMSAWCGAVAFSFSAE